MQGQAGLENSQPCLNKGSKALKKSGFAWLGFRDIRLTSSSAFLAPRIASNKSRSPSPDLRKDSRMDEREAGGAG
jgi:hypothetical protein